MVLDAAELNIPDEFKGSAPLCQFGMWSCCARIVDPQNPVALSGCGISNSGIILSMDYNTQDTYHPKRFIMNIRQNFSQEIKDKLDAGATIVLDPLTFIACGKFA